MNSSRDPQPLAELSEAGVSVWLDDLSRELLAGGGLSDLVTDRHVVGVTTNPTIFASALSHGERYTDQLRELSRAGASVDDAVFAITTADVRAACLVLRPVFAATDGADGRVSIEVDPRLSRDAEATVAQARALVAAVDEPNMFVKVPATVEGLAAITELTAQGVSVNVTLIFSLDRYRQVVDAYLTGLEQAAEAGRDLSAIHSVASFFVSRVDTAIDAKLNELATAPALALRGRAAIANARLAYQMFEQTLAGERWQRLSERSAGKARPQRPLWASTGVKNPAYPDTMYVTELIAPHTVNTMPGATLAAFADHGEVRGDTVTDAYDDARAVFDALGQAGVDHQGLIGALEQEGLTKFEDSWQGLGRSVADELHAATQKSQSAV
ncbi:MAG TPA: transaldolase [Actinocrinis sp.]|nr:transaldolase [Actinocrinis sp.]